MAELITGPEQPQGGREADLAGMQRLADEIAASTPEESTEAAAKAAADAEVSAAWADEQAARKAVAAAGDYPSAEETLASDYADQTRE